MLCKKYEELGHFEKVTYIGELLHAVQSDNDLYEKGLELIKEAKDKGLFDGVKFFPDTDTRYGK